MACQGRVTLRYTTDDDGIHLDCSEHGEVTVLGFEPTAEDAMRATLKHREEDM